MDPFTQRMLERTKMRREKLDQHFSRDGDLRIRQPLQEKNSLDALKNEENVKCESNITKEPASSSNLENIDSENRLISAYEQYDKDSESTANNDYNNKIENKAKPCKFGRLAELATKIKQWEDEIDKPKQPPSAKSSSNMCNVKAVKHSRNVVQTNKLNVEENKKGKQVIWDKSIIKSLESQGYSLSQNESRLIYDFDKEGARTKCESSSTKVTSPINREKNAAVPSKKEILIPKSCGTSPKITENKDSAVLKKAAFFESHTRSSPVKVEKDPTLLSISERKAIFERNAGEVLLPKVAFATPLPAKLMGDKNKVANDRIGSKIKTVANNWEKNEETGNLRKNPCNSESSGVPNKQQAKYSELKESENNVKKQKEMLERKVALEKVGEAPETRNPDVLLREKELEFLRSRWEHNKNMSESNQPTIPRPPPMPPLPAESHKNINVGDEKVDINADEKKGLYPSLSEFEESDDSDVPTTDKESANESRNSNIYLNMSFSDILEAKKNDPLSSNENSFDTELRESQVLSKMDEFLDNALNELSSTDNDDHESEEDDAPSPPKMLKSTSFIFKSNKEEESSVNPLVHTVSFYRKQQQNSVNNQTPNSVKSIKREEVLCESMIVDEEALVENKIQVLLQEINKQQTIISQASQALNLCLATIEFSGSGEQVESERLLLLANHKRQACLNEIQRLKVESTIRPLGCNQHLTDKGDVVITNISIPLKRDALRSMAAVESMQYLVCLIKSDERVIATQAVPATRDNLKNAVLCFPGQYKLENLLSDFKVTIEVYNLELNKEMLPHEVKYHINNKKDKKLLTPIKSKKTDSKLIMPYVQSPAGPNAVRSSNFHLCGYIVFSLREVSRTHWTLNKVPYTSPLEGSFSMKIQSQLQLDTEFKGFLTMFDDISGFGAWHRRWCLLSSHTLSYWKYPDDETRKVPIGTIDLRGVITENVGLVSRDICARLHTFLLETTRPRVDDDKDSLVVNVQGDITTIRHLLSADSKEEMLVWCRKLNTTLTLLRSWRCNFVP